MEITKSSDSNLIDLSNENFDKILEVFKDLILSNKYVLHGTNTNHPYAILEPRQANDSSKESGNKNAVYATIIPEFALQHALINRKYLDQKLQSYVTGHSKTGSEITFKASPNLYQLYLDKDPEIFSDGVIYVLDKSKFNTSPDAASEYHSLEAVNPVNIYKIPSKVGYDLFEGKLRSYTDEEIKKIDEFNEKLKQKPA